MPGTPTEMSSPQLQQVTILLFLFFFFFKYIYIGKEDQHADRIIFYTISKQVLKTRSCLGNSSQSSSRKWSQLIWAT